jgi:L-amino acid N-acyltransferase YncA
MSGFKIRDAGFDDLPGILEIQNDIILNTTAIWDDEPNDLAKQQKWMEERQAQNAPILVAEQNGKIIGFASFGNWRSRCCYQRTVESTVHIHRDFRRWELEKHLR